MERWKDGFFSSCTLTEAVLTASFQPGRPREKRKELMKRHLDPEKPKRGRTDWKRVDALSDEQITAAARNDPNAKPLSKAKLASMQRLPDVKAIRLKLSMTQEQFAIAFQLDVVALIGEVLDKDAVG